MGFSIKKLIKALLQEQQCNLSTLYSKATMVLDGEDTDTDTDTDMDTDMDTDTEEIDIDIEMEEEIVEEIKFETEVESEGETEEKRSCAFQYIDDAFSACHCLIEDNVQPVVTNDAFNGCRHLFD